MRSNGDGDMKDERESILFLIGKSDNKIILKLIHSELQWAIYIKTHSSWLLNFFSNSNPVGAKF